MSFTQIAEACGYEYVVRVQTEEELKNALAECRASSHKKLFVEVLVKPGSRPDLGRPKTTPEQNKQMFMQKNFA